ncbi:MAG TPA: hypothetical protein VHB98_08985, partial [Chloroflexota bacterium]|nr:hypothetical protein [Chloroflexota bacterium]
MMHRSLTTLARGTAALILAAALAGNVAGSSPASAQRTADTAANEVDGPNILINGGFERGADP